MVALPMLEWSECLLPTQKIVPARSIAVSYLWTPVARNVTGYVTATANTAAVRASRAEPEKKHPEKPLLVTGPCRAVTDRWHCHRKERDWESCR